jgi:hypothetical protein
MARRGKNVDPQFEAAVPLAGLLVFSPIFWPSVRQALGVMGVILTCVLAIVFFGGVVAAVIVRQIFKKSNPPPTVWDGGPPLRPDRPLRSYNMATLESVEVKTPENPRVITDESGDPDGLLNAGPAE